jgi:hypothetical protein
VATAGWPGKMPFVFNVIVKAMSALGLVLALLALWLLLRQTFARARNSSESTARAYVFLIIAICVLYIGAAISSFSLSYDRYFLVILPLALALLWKGQRLAALEGSDMSVRLRPIGVGVGLVSLAFYLTFATAATHDYLDWSRVRWNTALSVADERAVPAADIDGGWEYNNYLANLDRFYKTRRERDAVMTIEEKRAGLWGATLDRSYRVSCRVAPGYEAIRTVSLSPWLPLAPTEFIVSKRTGPSP